MKSIQQANKAYIQIMISLGFVPTSKLFEGIDLDEEILSTLEYLDLVDAIKIVKNINRYCLNPNWAAVFGYHLGVATHGPVGYAAISAPTMGKAISTFVEWFQIRSECYSSRLVEVDEAFDIFIQDTTGDNAFKSFFFEAFIRACEVLITLVLGHRSSGKTDIFFASIPNTKKALLKNEYDSTLHFNADANKFTVPKTIWFAPSPLSDPDSHELNLQKSKQLMAQVDFGHRVDLTVRNIIRQHFDNKLVQAHFDEALPSFKRMSVLTHQTERTLTRKLNKLGVSYKKILEEERKQFADKLLKDGRYTINDISYLLGYNEPPSFCRAFKTWFGMKPSEYRRSPFLYT